MELEVGQLYELITTTHSHTHTVYKLTCTYVCMAPVISYGVDCISDAWLDFIFTLCTWSNFSFSCYSAHSVIILCFARILADQALGIVTSNPIPRKQVAENESQRGAWTSGWNFSVILSLQVLGWEGLSCFNLLLKSCHEYYLPLRVRSYVKSHSTWDRQRQ